MSEQPMTDAQALQIADAWCAHSGVEEAEVSFADSLESPSLSSSSTTKPVVINSQAEIEMLLTTYEGFVKMYAFEFEIPAQNKSVIAAQLTPAFDKYGDKLGGFTERYAAEIMGVMGLFGLGALTINHPAIKAKRAAKAAKKAEREAKAQEPELEASETREADNA